MQADGKILAGGLSPASADSRAAAFARLTNDTAALQNLAVTQTTITWTRGGSSPQFTRVTFEYSTDNVNYTPLGNGTAPAGSNWTLTGLSLPTGQNFYIRARGYYRSGYQTARRASRNQCGMLLFGCANPNTYADTASFGKHIRHCHLLLESGPAPSAKCDDDPDWHRRAQPCPTARVTTRFHLCPLAGTMS